MKSSVVVLSILMLALCVRGACAQSGASNTITLAADEWCPYNCDPASDAPGYMVEIAQKAFAPQGLTVSYQVLNWARAVSDARSGVFSGVIGAIEGDAEGFVFPSVAQGKDDSHFFIRKGFDWKFAGVDSLRPLRVGIIRDYSYGETLDAYFEELGEGDHVQLASGDNGMETNIKKLLAERIDVIIANPYVFQYEAKRLGVQDQIADVGPQGEPTPLYIAFSPADPQAKEHAEQLARTTQALRASGELATILAKYGLTDWE
ncbi:substrate-binding periplasmic protein [Megalodesulfovibrio paquesii]